MMQVRDRREVLQALLNFDAPAGQLKKELSSFPWESDGPLVTLDRGHVRSVLQRYIDGTLTAAEVEGWANLLESREDVGYERGSEDALRDVVFELANPSLTAVLSKAHAADMVARIA